MNNILFRTLRKQICLAELQTDCQSRFLSSSCNKSKKKSKHGSGGGKKHPVKGRIALITGGSVGIGYSMGKLLLACGAKGVFLGGRREDAGRKAVCKLSEEFGDNKVIFMKCDVSKEKDLIRAFKCTKEYFKGLDIVVNNAGILKDNLWRETIQINCMGLLHGCLLGFEHMGTHKGNKGGVIVNNASIVGLQEFHGSPVYGASKHFVIGVTRNLGHKFYYKQSKVKVMAICPGVTSTYMVDNAKRTGLKQFKGCGKETDKQLGSLPSQPSDACGCHLITMLEDGENGSIWVSEDSETYKIKLPDRLSLRVKGGKQAKSKKGRKSKRGKKKKNKKCSKRNRKGRKGNKNRKRRGKKGSSKCKKDNRNRKNKKSRKNRKSDKTCSNNNADRCEDC